jgi:N-acetylmuramoyl-L-alanine amidase
MKVAFVIGHDEKSKGATSKHFFEGREVSEYTFWKFFVLKNMLDYGDIFTHESISSYDKKQRTTAEKTKDYDLVIEFHFNSFNGKAQGVEALHYYKNNKTKAICEEFSDLVSEKMGIKKRGLNGATASSSGNGYGFLYHTKQWAILLEPFFGDNASDCKKFDEKLFKEVIIETIAYAKKLKA